jgi:hypothetical protein
MSVDEDAGRRSPQDRVADLNAEIRETANFGEVVLQGDIGVHSFFVPENSRLPMGEETAKLMAFSRATREITLDPDVVRDNQGEMTPEAIADEALAQFEDLMGKRYFWERFAEELESVFEQAEDRYGPHEGSDA